MSGKMKNTINSRQIKAARALLDWSQEDLASASGLSIATIRKIESGALSPRDKTMGAIVSALEDMGVEFNGSTGVRIKERDIETIEGDDCFTILADKIYHDMKYKNVGEILFMNADGSRMNDAEWASLVRLRSIGVRFRLLIEEGNTNIHGPIDVYRWVPKKYFKYNLITIFEDKVAISIYGRSLEQDMGKVIIINSAVLAEAMRGSFDFLWENCRKPTLTTAPQMFE